MQYSRAVKVARTNRGLTQVQLARQASVNRSHLSQIESGKRRPSLETLEKIAETLDIPLYLLFLLGAEKGDLREGISEYQAGAIGSILLGLVKQGDDPGGKSK